MKPEIAPGFAQDCLVVVVNFLMANPTGVNRRRIGVLWVEHHGLIGRIHLTRAHGHRFGCHVRRWPGWATEHPPGRRHGSRCVLHVRRMGRMLRMGWMLRVWRMGRMRSMGRRTRPTHVASTSMHMPSGSHDPVIRHG